MVPTGRCTLSFALRRRPGTPRGPCQGKWCSHADSLRALCVQNTMALAQMHRLKILHGDIRPDAFFWNLFSKSLKLGRYSRAREEGHADDLQAKPSGFGGCGLWGGLGSSNYNPISHTATPSQALSAPRYAEKRPSRISHKSGIEGFGSTGLGARGWDFWFMVTPPDPGEAWNSQAPTPSPSPNPYFPPPPNT